MEVRRYFSKQRLDKIVKVVISTSGFDALGAAGAHYGSGPNVDPVVDLDNMVLEGGQSFIPMHSISEVKKGILDACVPILSGYETSTEEVKEIVTTSRLHN